MPHKASRECRFPRPHIPKKKNDVTLIAKVRDLFCHFPGPVDAVDSLLYKQVLLTGWVQKCDERVDRLWRGC
eukprot:1972243-Rhodomonas_salina.3